MLRYRFLFWLLFFCASLHGQVQGEDLLGQALSDPAKENISRNDSIVRGYVNAAGPELRRSLVSFFDRQIQKSHHAASRGLAWKGMILCSAPFTDLQAGHQVMERAIHRAVESRNDYLLVEIFELCAYGFISGQQQKALFYYLKSAELRKRLGDNYFVQKDAAVYGTIGELLYRVQDYRQAVEYLQKMMKLPSPGVSPYMTSMNTMALAYQRMAKYDSAMYWYTLALRGAKARNDSVWQGIIRGNMGAVYFEQGLDEAALPLLWEDYHTTKNAEAGNAGNTLHRLAHLYLRKGKTDSALLLARQSLQLVSLPGVRNGWFQRNACGALAAVYKKLGWADSAIYYNDRYHSLSDSMNRWVADNRADLVQARLEFEEKANVIQVLLQEKSAEETRRNLLLAALVLLLLTAWLYLRWQRQRHLNQEQFLRHQKERAEAEVQNAREQLDAFTTNSIAKNELIEQLQEQLALFNQKVNDELVQQTILTESDWLRFRHMFDKAHPGFLLRLQQTAPGITTAELRLAALIKLQIGNKHISSMLGIGTDAVRKTKSRLRQRLGITIEHDLDAYVAQLAAGSDA